MICYITTFSKRINYILKMKQLLEKSGFEYYFVYGKNNTNKLEPYIEVDCEELYENLPLKTYFILEHFLKTKHSHMFKLDDDTYVNFEKFNKRKLEEDYIGMFLTYPDTLKSSIFHWYTVNTPEYKVKKPTFNLEYAEGGGYILSRKAATLCYNRGYSFFDSTPETYLGEDTKIGLCLKDQDITKQDIMYNKDLQYETTKELDLIHPVHFLLFDKISECKNPEEIKICLLKHNFLNLNVHRDIYLNKMLKTLK